MTEDAHLILHVCLPVPLRLAYFEYLPPLNDQLTAKHADQLLGCRLAVPFRHQKLIGIIVGHSSSPATPIDKLKRATALIEARPLLPIELIQQSLWLSHYYCHPPGDTLFTFLPADFKAGKPAPVRKIKAWQHTTEGLGLPENGLKNKKKQALLHRTLLENKRITETELKDLGLSLTIANKMVAAGLIQALALDEDTQSEGDDFELLAETALPLNEQQATCLAKIRYHQYTSYLLYGVTGSGKTELYMHAIAKALQLGKQALVLIPEIGLTPQTVSRFKRRFKIPIAEMHSNLASGKRYVAWHDAITGKIKLLIGTRLAAATPMPNLGIIVVDEEHDPSFKQNDGLRYSARDIATLKAQKHQIPLILGSATPSLESLHNVEKNKYELLKLTERAASARPPSITLIDLRREDKLAGGISNTALAEIKTAIEQRQQVLVFINRRGFAPVLLCRTCGWTASCQSCDAKLSLHSHPRQLRCHHCDRRHGVPQTCPSCHGQYLMPQGAGTERCEEYLVENLPGTAVIRVDTDSMSKKNAIKDLSERVLAGEPCVLVGTQMLAKGHHFPYLGLVVIADCDNLLFSSDIKSTERLAQQVTQVAGRAGRAEVPGKVLLQTFRPDHPLLAVLLNKGYGHAAKELLQQRQSGELPPYWHMAIIRAESKRAENALDLIKLSLSIARQHFPASPDIKYLGPMPCLIEKVQDRWRFQAQIVCKVRKTRQSILQTLVETLETNALSKRVRWSIDVDPQDLS